MKDKCTFAPYNHNYHVHVPELSSVAVVCDGALDPNKVLVWFNSRNHCNSCSSSLWLSLVFNSSETF